VKGAAYSSFFFPSRTPTTTKHAAATTLIRFIVSKGKADDQRI
jgi:hypothetical protein